MFNRPRIANPPVDEDIHAYGVFVQRLRPMSAWKTVAGHSLMIRGRLAVLGAVFLALFSNALYFFERGCDQANNIRGEAISWRKSQRRWGDTDGRRTGFDRLGLF